MAQLKVFGQWPFRPVKRLFSRRLFLVRYHHYVHCKPLWSVELILIILTNFVCLGRLAVFMMFATCLPLIVSATLKKCENNSHSLRPKFYLCTLEIYNQLFTILVNHWTLLSPFNTYLSKKFSNPFSWITISDWFYALVLYFKMCSFAPRFFLSSSVHLLIFYFSNF